MNKNFKKNRLDLAYRKQLTYLNAILTFISIGIISFIGTFIWNKDYFIYGLFLIIIVLIVSYAFYLKVDKNLKTTFDKIKKL